MPSYFDKLNKLKQCLKIMSDKTRKSSRTVNLKTNPLRGAIADFLVVLFRTWYKVTRGMVICWNWWLLLRGQVWLTEQQNHNRRIRTEYFMSVRSDAGLVIYGRRVCPLAANVQNKLDRGRFHHMFQKSTQSHMYQYAFCVITFI